MTVKQILAKEGLTESSALKDQAMLVAMSKSSHFEAECRGFERKYGVSLAKMKKRTETLKDREDFSVEDDLMKWEFAGASLKWWRERVEEVRLAV